jgi:hypothetical protein
MIIKTIVTNMTKRTKKFNWLGKGGTFIDGGSSTTVDYEVWTACNDDRLRKDLVADINEGHVVLTLITDLPVQQLPVRSGQVVKPKQPKAVPAQKIKAAAENTAEKAIPVKKDKKNGKKKDIISMQMEERGFIEGSIEEVMAEAEPVVQELIPEKAVEIDTVSLEEAFETGKGLEKEASPAPEPVPMDEAAAAEKAARFSKPVTVKRSAAKSASKPKTAAAPRSGGTKSKSATPDRSAAPAKKTSGKAVPKRTAGTDEDLDI